MRATVEQAVISGYKHGLDEVSSNGKGITGPWENPDGSIGSGRYAYMLTSALHDALQNGRITIEHYVSMLSDEQLLAAFDSQCCLRYR